MKLEEYIKKYHNTEDFKEAIASAVTSTAGNKGMMTKKLVKELIKDAIDWGVKYADSYPNKLN